MYRNFMILLVVFIFSGCSFKNSDVITKKYYKDISKDALLDAGKKVFILSGDDFLVDTYRDELNVTRAKAAYGVFTMDLILYNFNLKLKQDENGTAAKLNIFRTYSPNRRDKESVGESVHNLFWSRMDYLLSLNDNWLTCKRYFFKGLDKDVFCDIVDLRDRKPTKADLIKDVELSKSKYIIKNRDITYGDLRGKYDNIDLKETVNKDILDESKLFVDENVTILDEDIQDLSGMEKSEDNISTNNEENLSLEVQEDINESIINPTLPNKSLLEEDIEITNKEN